MGEYHFWVNYPSDNDSQGKLSLTFITLKSSKTVPNKHQNINDNK